MQTVRILLTAALAFVSGAGRAVLGQDQSAPAVATPPASIHSSVAAVSAPAPVSPLLAAALLYRSGKMSQAAEAYQEILKTDAKSSSAYVGLMRVQLRERRLSDAEASLAAAVRLAAQSDEVQTAQAELYFRQGRLEDAELSLEKLIKNHTQQARAYWVMGAIYWANSNFQHAKILLDTAHDRDPGDPDIRRRWLMTETSKDPARELQIDIEGESDDPKPQEQPPSENSALPESGGKQPPGCRMVSHTSELHVPMLKLMDGTQEVRGYGLRVDFNGARGTLLLDTGAYGLLISRKLAQKAGIKSLAASDVHGIGDQGAASGYVGTVDSLKFGDLEFRGCPVQVLDRNSLTDEDGLIGPEFFDDFLVTVNFPDARFELTALPAMPVLSEEAALAKRFPNSAKFHDRYIAREMKDYTPVYRFSHMLLIPTRINNSKPRLFLIDTGAFSNTIAPQAAKEFTKIRVEDQLKVKGLNGAVNKVFTASDLTLAFSHFRQPAIDTVVFDTDRISEGAGTEISGILGFAMLYQMKLKIDYRDGLVDFEYDRNRFH